MVKISIFSILSATLLIAACAHLKQNTVTPYYKTGDKTSSVDTSINIRMDTSLTSDRDGIESINDSVAWQYLRPFFVQDICEPGNYDHPVYKRFYEKGLKVKDQALKSFFFRAATHPRVIEELKRRNITIKDFNNIEVKQFFIYSIAANILGYKKGEDLKKYYTLDTSKIVLRIIKNNNTFMLLNFINDRSGFIEFYAGDSLSFLQAKSADKEPLGLVNQIILPDENFGTYYDNLGFIVNKKLFITDCGAGNYIVKRNYYDTVRHVYDYDTVRYFYNIDCNTMSVNQYIKNRYGFLKTVIDGSIQFLKRKSSQ